MAIIVLFDGVCKFCNGWVNFLLARDSGNQFRFATLQSAVAKKLLEPGGIDTANMDTVIVLHEGKAFQKSAAVLLLAEKLGFPYSLLGIGGWLPLRWRDAIYDAIASRRYQWFGKMESCRVPSPEERDKFLDLEI
ncbi:MAG: DCC1-like thiol-disulfide oxidoreductase family protein [Chitinophagales bacterium]